MPTSGDRDVLHALKRELARRTGLPDRRDAYFYFLRLGTDWHRYEFWWEPFRDLAGALRPGPDAIPVVLVSDGSGRAAPSTERAHEPSPHVQVRVSPACDVASVARAWLEAVVVAGAKHLLGPPYDWFPRRLQVSPEQLGERARRFLAL
jgi:hypothetical protein